MKKKMKKLFLSSSFEDVYKLLSNFIKEEMKGKKVTFIPTASIPEEVTFYVGTGKKSLEKLGLIVDELELTKATSKEISSKLENNDYIYISGGNTFFLLQELRRTGADKIIIDQINLGKLYIGESAGSVILSPDIEYIQGMGDYREKAPNLESNLGLSVIDFYPLPHYTNPPFAELAKKVKTQYESKLKLIPMSNSQVIMITGDKVKIESKYS